MLGDAYWDDPAILSVLAARDVPELLRGVQRLTQASQTQIGVAIGCSQGEVSSFMNATRRRRILNADLLTRIATGLAMPDHAAATLLLGRIIQPAPPPDAPAVDPRHPHDDQDQNDSTILTGLTFGPIMRILRRAAGLSTRTLAGRTNYTHAAISQAENGRRPPTRELAEALDCALNANGQLIEAAADGSTRHLLNSDLRGSGTRICRGLTLRSSRSPTFSNACTALAAHWIMTSSPNCAPPSTIRSQGTRRFITQN